jgi:hypothetical protein
MDATLTEPRRDYKTAGGLADPTPALGRRDPAGEGQEDDQEGCEQEAVHKITLPLLYASDRQI